jgi:putative PIN family toxin of toxin-antitoxin system
VIRRAVLDSNVIVSALGWSGAPARIVDGVLAGELVLVTSAPLTAELRRVLAYPKLARAIPDGSRLADLIEMSSVIVEPTDTLAVVEDESPGMAAYGASRAAIELLTKAWAAEFGPQNVRVNAVAPGPTLTPAVEPMLEMAKEFAKQIPLGRLGDVHELSEVITFLATPAAGYINGAVIHVDGGRTAI